MGNIPNCGILGPHYDGLLRVGINASNGAEPLIIDWQNPAYFKDGFHNPSKDADSAKLLQQLIPEEKNRTGQWHLCRFGTESSFYTGAGSAPADGNPGATNDRSLAGGVFAFRYDITSLDPLGKEVDGRCTQVHTIAGGARPLPIKDLLPQEAAMLIDWAGIGSSAMCRESNSLSWKIGENPKTLRWLIGLIDPSRRQEIKKRYDNETYIWPDKGLAQLDNRLRDAARGKEIAEALVALEIVTSDRRQADADERGGWQQFWTKSTSPISWAVGAASILLGYFTLKLFRKTIGGEGEKFKPIDLRDVVRKKTSENPNYYSPSIQQFARGFVENMRTVEIPHGLIKGPSGGGKDYGAEAVAYLVENNDPVLPEQFRSPDTRVYLINATELLGRSDAKYVGGVIRALNDIAKESLEHPVLLILQEGHVAARAGTASAGDGKVDESGSYKSWFLTTVEKSRAMYDGAPTQQYNLGVVVTSSDPDTYFSIIPDALRRGHVEEIPTSTIATIVADKKATNGARWEARFGLQIPDDIYEKAGRLIPLFRRDYTSVRTDDGRIKRMPPYTAFDNLMSKAGTIAQKTRSNVLKLEHLTQALGEITNRKYNRQEIDRFLNAPDPDALMEDGTDHSSPVAAAAGQDPADVALLQKVMRAANGDPAALAEMQAMFGGRPQAPDPAAAIQQQLTSALRGGPAPAPASAPGLFGAQPQSAPDLIAAAMAMDPMGSAGALRAMGYNVNPQQPASPGMRVIPTVNPVSGTAPTEPPPPPAPLFGDPMQSIDPALAGPAAGTFDPATMSMLQRLKDTCEGPGCDAQLRETWDLIKDYPVQMQISIVEQLARDPSAAAALSISSGPVVLSPNSQDYFRHVAALPAAPGGPRIPAARVGGGIIPTNAVSPSLPNAPAAAGPRLPAGGGLTGGVPRPRLPGPPRR